MDCQVFLVLQDDKGHLVRKELKDQQGLKDLMVKRAKEVSQAQLVYQELEDHQGHLAILGNQELQGFKDLQAYLAILVSLELKVRLVRLEELSMEQVLAQWQSQDHLGALVLLAHLALQDSQVLLALLDFLVSLVLKVIREIKENRVL